MLDIGAIRSQSPSILAVGNYRPGIQAVLDFDYLCDKKTPSIRAIVTVGKRFDKYFWGSDEVLIPCFDTIAAAQKAGTKADWLLNLSSARRAATITDEFFTSYPTAQGAHIFAEDVPEITAIDLSHRYRATEKVIVGPAGVGLIVPGTLKLGAIGGVDWRQLNASRLGNAGTVAILSASGGMINELITITARTQHTISFALCFGGDRFPSTTPKDGFLAAQSDPNTKAIVYYGELGGQDEYELVDLLETGVVTKPVYCYVAGVIGEQFASPIQFGHAKALARSRDETASAKREALQAAGAHVAHSMKDFGHMIQSIPTSDTSDTNRAISPRKASLFTSTISAETDQGYAFCGRTLQDWTTEPIEAQIAAALLGKPAVSALTTDFIRTVFLLSIDHGPQVSGAVNTIVTARAGKGIVDSLAAGLLTIGPRFGGAVTDAARQWFEGVSQQQTAEQHVESYASRKQHISGIGHKKYRLDLPDPRTIQLAKFADKLPSHPYFDYAKAIEAITTQKKGNLILNVDGHIAALMLDILSSEEKCSPQELQRLIEADFFNALFIIPRIVGFSAHYLDQKRLDEGLFRLPDDDVLLA